ncbi:SMC-Scp complex subunit ScpB [Lactobacillus hominis]|uniref:Segregation and condensation protein B n=1 Tax=Lactobacillus hominis DSM 23910 = CRBIP 24.179 TaxID=1423758 RepID=I7KGU0_9LACO|nr:SMC-Scp complex subunit ScpB [Lactobacillus hominis]KRM85901.1 segregation and condensation protein B [Lactobacillus hominis DSM 23910 = CRBIP 24.179]MCT3348864.1 SMC-Scp complex subunit ScpB [Lactobacillus hominis]CCI81545.1 Segregation and condensation protein B [Lactobacillus hominis DSM 23910 = CRBIP 24.179]
MANKQAELEAVLYAAGDSGVEQEILCQLLEISQPALRELSNHLKDNLNKRADSGLQLILINNTFKLTTSPKCADVISKFFQKDVNKSLSQSALEILSIIAYRQPITRIEIDEIRGVNSSGAIQTLIWRGLVKIDGKKDVPGHPNLYVTTDYFLQYFGYKSLADLPLIENFSEDIDENGQVDLFESKGKADAHLENNDKLGD